MNVASNSVQPRLHLYHDGLITPRDPREDHQADESEQDRRADGETHPFSHGAPLALHVLTLLAAAILLASIGSSRRLLAA